MVQEKLKIPGNYTSYEVSLLLELMQVLSCSSFSDSIFCFQTSESDLPDFQVVCSEDNMVISEEFKRNVLF